MFSLIITIIAVSLTVVLIAATMYYGGNSITGDARSEAQVAGKVSEIGQFKAAMQMYKLDHGVMPTEAAQLLDKDYLSAIPKGWGESELQLQNIESIAAKLEGSEFAGCCKTA